MKRILYIASFIILLGSLLTYFVLKNQETNLGCATEDIRKGACGTSGFNESGLEGRSLFNTNCAACHSLYRVMTGPALKDVGKKYDSLTIIKFLHGEKTAIINKDYDNNCMVFKNLTNEDILDILKYTDHSR
ncbi:cytochrome c [uncultured Psychroserpens sp.]|uniref:c-type cytochrome n=1 Tax=uncultured Psychroserpens sp. TaxID=255436 RepID=UPI0026125C5F|nr:cytochrome c [uncultured Psychroserpens sp.]